MKTGIKKTFVAVNHQKKEETGTLFEGMNGLLGYSYVFRVIQLTSIFPVSSTTNKSLLYLNLFDANYIL